MIETVWLDNPPVNAVNGAIIETLWSAFESLGDDVRAVVLRGRGERAFSAGADISGFVGGMGEGDRPGGIQPVADLIERAPVPVVAAIHGFCLGGGLELAMCCDVRVASDDAQLGQPEIKLGLIPGGGGTQRLPRLVGHGRAMLLNLGGEFLDAHTALDWGLVEKVVPREELLDAAVAIAATFAERSPHAIAVLRELARTTRDLPLEEGLRREADGFARCLRSDDGQEGVAAFLEKRAPRFTGR